MPMNLRTVGSPKGFTFRSSCRYHVSFATSATGNDHIDKNTAPDHEVRPRMEAPSHRK